LPSANFNFLTTPSPPLKQAYIIPDGYFPQALLEASPLRDNVVKKLKFADGKYFITPSQNG